MVMLETLLPNWKHRATPSQAHCHRNSWKHWLVVCRAFDSCSLTRSHRSTRWAVHDMQIPWDYALSQASSATTDHSLFFLQSWNP